MAVVGIPAVAISSESPVDSETYVLLGFDNGVMSGIPIAERKGVRSILFGSNEEVVELLRSQAPTLELELDFQIGRIILQGVDTDVAWALPHVRALVESEQPALKQSVAAILRQVAAYGSTAEQLDKRFEVLLKKLPAVPVPHSLLELQRSHFECAGDFVQVLPGRCWVVPHVLTAQECEDWICKAQTHGLEASRVDAARHNSRTKDFVDLDMAQLVWSRLPAELQREVEVTAPNTDVRNVHEEWRISMYKPGQFFRAHYDESYTRGSERLSQGSEKAIRNLQGEHGEASSHTLLLILSDGFSKGATRFWPTGKYDEAVDVTAPRGSMLVFEQLTLLHEGCALAAGVKFVAQGALMRAPPSGFIPKPIQRTFDRGFQFGPGMSSLSNVR
uniref:Prolyl 4-hydroxylase alpha subunit domain-containing protein n=1 Tax=Zooxanthella nutricula TaxID=1333877 RepID=A0A7S2KGI7_9DINO